MNSSSKLQGCFTHKAKKYLTRRKGMEGEESIPCLVPAARREEAGVHAVVSSRSFAPWEKRYLPAVGRNSKK
jgi:hypothetical protein